MGTIIDIDDLNNTAEENKFIKSADLSKTKKNKGGRPKKEAKDKASEQIFINVTESEKIKIELAAKELGISISALCKVSLAKFLL